MRRISERESFNTYFCFILLKRKMKNSSRNLFIYFLIRNVFFWSEVYNCVNFIKALSIFTRSFSFFHSDFLTNPFWLSSSLSSLILAFLVMVILLKKTYKEVLGLIFYILRVNLNFLIDAVWYGF